MAVSDLVAVGSGLATIAAAAVVSFQLVLLKRQQTDEFLSSFNKRYDDIISGVPLSILIDRHSSRIAVDDRIERAIFDYAQLCEEQLTLLVNRNIVDLAKNGAVPISVDSKKGLIGKTPSKTGLWLSNREQWQQASIEWIDGIKRNFSSEVMKSCFYDLQSRSSKPEGKAFAFLSLLVEPPSENGS
jgi:hypothetical protein